MPKPLFLHRPAGLYVRFRVPADLLPVVGSRFLVRPLRMVKGDRARLVAETMAVALSEAFDRLRQGNVVDLKKALDAARSGGRGDLTLGEVALPNGTVLRNVQIDNDQDARQFQAIVREASEQAASPQAKGPAVQRPGRVKQEDMLTHQLGVHVRDLERAGSEKKTILDSRHTLRLFAGIIGDKPVAALTSDDCRLFFDEVCFWPRNASKIPGNKDLSVRDIIRKAKAVGVEPPAGHTLSKHRQRLSAFFNFLIENDKVQRNPLKGIAKASSFDTDEDTGRAFTQAELDAIFEPVAFAAWSAKYPHRFWAPLIGLFTGARVTEVSPSCMSMTLPWNTACRGSTSGRESRVRSSKTKAPSASSPLRNLCWTLDSSTLSRTCAVPTTSDYSHTSQTTTATGSAGR
ncbi:hypothetical protein J2T07_003095 [Luteibacter jiangsuensis]|uniref:DUF6538 domain-containing protein n=1 Tax=Luteibacter jiangsuensis TaxID=637577 RepID=A0ABT9T0T7_9GAMM|nr:hypothetical protein [Luteibacter jiangsuensis]